MSLELKNIICPLDFSQRIEKNGSVDYAAKLANEDTVILLLHVAELFLLPDSNGNWYDGDMMTEFINNSKKKLNSYFEEIQKKYPDLKFKTLFGEQKDPGDFILEQSKNVSADLIIMNSHGRKGLNRILMGSVTEYVMRHSTCPVLVIKESSI
jgi:nucleotide-binding universal stress UspA family protein